MTAASSNSSEPQAPALGAPLPGPASNGQPPPPSATEPSVRLHAATEAEPIIELHDVGVWYQLHRKRLSLKQALLRGRFHEKPRVLWALRHINLTCHRGQTIGIIGHNGAGKSTLCLVLARILSADEGQTIIRGKTTPLFGLGTGFNNELTGRANIFLYAAFLGIPRRVVESKIGQIIEFSELGDFIDEPIFTYSSGMRGRLGFSVAAILEPEILILDEVLGTGDRAFRAKSRKRIRQMMHQSKLIFIVSHFTGFLYKTCTHCLWLDHGKQRMFGEAEMVLNAYEEATGGKDSDSPHNDDED